MTRSATGTCRTIVDDATLVVTELVTNAVTHGGSAFRLQLSRTSGAFRIEVVDEGEGTPEPQPQDIEAEGGRGIMLVDAMSSSWGVENVPQRQGGLGGDRRSRERGSRLTRARTGRVAPAAPRRR